MKGAEEEEERGRGREEGRGRGLKGRAAERREEETEALE